MIFFQPIEWAVSKGGAVAPRWGMNGAPYQIRPWVSES